MSIPQNPEPFQPSFAALDAFAEYLYLASVASPSTGGAPLLESFAMAAPPEQREALLAELQRLGDDWQYLHPLRDVPASRTSFLQLLLQLYGEGGSDGVESKHYNLAETPREPAPATPPAALADDADALLEFLLARGHVAQKYQFRGKIETGGMGVVWRVYDREARRMLAMKMMREPTTRAKRHDSNEMQHLQVRRFLEEAQVTSQLDHPGIVPVHELGMDSSGRVFFTMKLVRGRDLKSIFEDITNQVDGWTIRRAVAILTKVCEALAFAHAKGVIHRDLKPSNIMVGRFGEVFVMDWGVARVISRPDLHDLRIRKQPETEYSTVHSMRRDIREKDPDSPLVTMDGSVLGTPAYMSPEQAMGLLESVGPKSDIYSIGAILYHLLSGHMPYVPNGARISQRTLLGMVVQGPPPAITVETPGADPALTAICNKSMARDPSKRYKSVEALRDDLTAWLEFRPLAARPPGLREALELYTKRNKKVVATAASAAAILIISGAFFLFHLQNEISAKTLAIEETETWRDGLRANRLFDQLQNGLRPLLAEDVEKTDAWLREVDTLAARAQKHAHDAAGARPGANRELSLVLEAIDTVARERARVAGQVALARTAHERSILQFQAEWDRARADIAASELYHQLKLRPQTGLVPLRKNPANGLWEFWLCDSGARPAIDPQTQNYNITDSTGIVLVLLPGGKFTRGYLCEDPDGEMETNETQLECNLAPFFISKFEITQGQWLRWNTNNPSANPRGQEPGVRYLLTNPVENVTWAMANHYSSALGCALPTESQWEYAARAGSEDRYWFGGDPADCYKNENLMDHDYGKFDPSQAAVVESAPSDGFAFHAPVGSFRPNGFGLLDMLGNVAEWCAEDYLEDLPAATDRPDGSVATPENAGSAPVMKSFRGGSFHDVPGYARCSFRRYVTPGYKNMNLGFRVARAIL